MITLSLNGSWKFKALDESAWHDALVPGSLYTDLINNGLLTNPYYRDHEDIAKAFTEKDYIYEKIFMLSEELFNSDLLLLKADGLDTICKIYLNGKLVAETKNMHIRYEIDIKEYALLGENSLRILFKSPIQFMDEKYNQHPLWASQDALPGISYLRKGHSMSGWDWGPQLPDLGIFRDILITGYNEGRIIDTYTYQTHENDKVTLHVKVATQEFGQNSLIVKITLITPDGITIYEKNNSISHSSNVDIQIDNPELWWPNGYGKQSLYQLNLELLHKDRLLDEKLLNIGLRTLTIKNEPDKWGESFEFVINGISIFSMGANYIPEDNLLANTSKNRTETLIKQCLIANFNTIRVWGGGIYPPDYFYDLCDQYGLIVWQDFMFACAVYPSDEAFYENITDEIIDNIKRIRHHASLGLWCGNNEMEAGIASWNYKPKRPEENESYLYQYETLIKNIVKENDPYTFYWPSSPSSKGGFDDPNDPNRGDVHYWDVWHGLKPFTDYRNFYFRFASEFGFQSFPDIKTVETFTEEEDRNIFSYVMERHQKNGAANGIILYYLSEIFKYPKDFDSLLYTSQLLQAEAIKYGVEHWRRNRGRCMGSIYWQLNDCWPVASWSSIDYYGRWKALHYFAKRFYSPVLLSIEEGETTASFYLTNETIVPVEGYIHWALALTNGDILDSGNIACYCEPLSAIKLATIDFQKHLSCHLDKANTYLEYSLLGPDNKIIQEKSSLLFLPIKHFEFRKPDIQFNINEDNTYYYITVTTSEFTKYIQIYFRDYDFVLSDNYFDLHPNSHRIVTIDKRAIEKNMSYPSCQEIIEQIRIRSIYDIA